MAAQSGRRGRPPKVWIAGILIAAAIVTAILAVSYTLGPSSSPVFGPPQACVTASGFNCQDLVFHNGVISFEFGQYTGTNWTSGVIYFVPYGQSYNPKIDTYSHISSLSGRMLNVSIAIPSSVSPSSRGTVLQGYLIANYTIGLGANATRTALQVASLRVKAT